MLSSSVTQRLKTKAASARSIAQRKAQHDKDCEMYEFKLLQNYNIYSLHDYLKNFYHKGFLDQSPHAFGNILKTTLRQVSKAQYIYLKDKNEEADIDSTWLQKQNDYIASLETQQIFDLYGYTYKGDTFVNQYSRDTFDVDVFMEYLNNELPNEAEEDYFPLFFPALHVVSLYGPKTINLIFESKNPPDSHIQDALKLLDPTSSYTEKYALLAQTAYRFNYHRFWVSVLEQYKQRLDDIIRNAPVTTSRMILYRGVRDDYFIPKSMLELRDRVHIARSFVSTTSSVGVLQRFTTYNECCVMRIYVPVGTRMVMLAGLTNMDEAEFLLGARTQFFITKTSSQKFCTNKHNLQMKVTDMVVIQ